MQSHRLIQTVDTHTEGQPTRIITSGLGYLPGDSIAAKREHFRTHSDHLRTALMAEPRGHRDMYGCILTQPSRPEAEIGIIYFHNSGYMDMCGHATIGLSTALVELGMVAVEEPVTRIIYDSVGGLVTALVKVEDGKALDVTFENVPGHVHCLGETLSVEGIGSMEVDVAYGGNDFVWFDADAISLEIHDQNARQIVDVAMRVMAAANEQLPVRDPATKASREINIATALTRPKTVAGPAVRNVHVFGPGQFDRSPGGTGTTARLAVMRAKGEIEPGVPVTVESGISDGRFVGRLLGEVDLGDGVTGYRTSVTGSAFVTGMHQFVMDPADRLKDGFLVR